MTDKKTSIKLPQKINIKAAVITSIVIFLIAGLYWSTRNTTLYNPNKNEVRAGVQAAMDAAKFPGEMVYSNFKDKGCFNNVTGLRTDTQCTFVFQKYFKSKGNPAQGLREADSILKKADWQRSFRAQQSAIDFEGGLNGDIYQQLMYSYKGIFPVLDLGFYAGPGKSSVYSIGSLISSHKIVGLKSDEYVYGISAETVYWACTNTPFFKQPCPQPPSKTPF